MPGLASGGAGLLWSARSLGSESVSFISWSSPLKGINLRLASLSSLLSFSAFVEMLGEFVRSVEKVCCVECVCCCSLQWLIPEHLF